MAFNYYRRGEWAEAFKYAQLAIEEAIECNILFRTNQISKFYSNINMIYQTKEAEDKRLLTVILMGISLLALCLILSLVYVYRQMRRISIMKEELTEANRELTHLNEMMKEKNE